LKGKTVLITGGTGTLGSALARRLVSDCKKVIVFSRDEHKQYEMRKEFNPDNIRYFIGDVRDAERLDMAFRGVDVVLHTAALKHVATGETDPLEVIKTNVNGAENIIRAAINNKVEKVFAVSTDKAVNPINLYGAAKLCADKLFIASNRYGVKFSVIRPGNFMGSRGSVIPHFYQLKRQNKPVTITDVRMTRFFISVDDAVERVISAVGMMEGGEIFCPKMPSINILDLAIRIYPGAEIKVIGATDGEKLHEDLILESDRDVWETLYFYIISKLQMGNPVQEGFEYRSSPTQGQINLKKADIWQSIS
jgi:UDP-N-acetylglucosamine 4,6-dehydratase